MPLKQFVYPFETLRRFNYPKSTRTLLLQFFNKLLSITLNYFIFCVKEIFTKFDSFISNSLYLCIPYIIIFLLEIIETEKYIKT